MLQVAASRAHAVRLASSPFTTSDDRWKLVDDAGVTKTAPVWNSDLGTISSESVNGPTNFYWKAPGYFNRGTAAYGGTLTFLMQSQPLTIGQKVGPQVYLEGNLNGTVVRLFYAGFQNTPPLGTAFTQYTVTLTEAAWLVPSTAGTAPTPATRGQFLCILKDYTLLIDAHYNRVGTNLDLVKLVGLNGKPAINLTPGAEGLKFGTVPVGLQGSVQQAFFNNGTLPLELNITRLNKEGVWSAAFSQGSGECPDVVAPGESRFVTVFFRPRELRRYLAGWAIQTNDVDFPSFSCLLRGRGGPGGGLGVALDTAEAQPAEIDPGE